MHKCTDIVMISIKINFQTYVSENFITNKNSIFTKQKKSFRRGRCELLIFRSYKETD